MNPDEERSLWDTGTNQTAGHMSPSLAGRLLTDTRMTQHKEAERLAGLPADLNETNDK